MAYAEDVSTPALRRPAVWAGICVVLALALSAALIVPRLHSGSSAAASTSTAVSGASIVAKLDAAGYPCVAPAASRPGLQPADGSLIETACQHDGDTVKIDVTNSAADLADVLHQVAAYGVVDPALTVTAAGWLVYAPSAADALTIRAALIG
jgi:hypothetical protein